MIYNCFDKQARFRNELFSAFQYGGYAAVDAVFYFPYLKTCDLLSKTFVLLGQRGLMELCGGLHHAVLGSQDWKHFLEIKILTRERQPQTPQQPRTNTTSSHKRAQTHSTGRRKREQNSKSALNLQQTSTKPSHNAHAAFTLTDQWGGKTRAETGTLNGFVCMCVKLMTIKDVHPLWLHALCQS